MESQLSQALASTEGESLVFDRDEYAKKDFWDDRFKEYLLLYSSIILGLRDFSIGMVVGLK